MTTMCLPSVRRGAGFATMAAGGTTATWVTGAGPGAIGRAWATWSPGEAIGIAGRVGALATDVGTDGTGTTAVDRAAGAGAGPDSMAPEDIHGCTSAANASGGTRSRSRMRRWPRP